MRKHGERVMIWHSNKINRRKSGDYVVCEKLYLIFCVINKKEALVSPLNRKRLFKKNILFSLNNS